MHKNAAPWVKRRVRSGGLTSLQIVDEIVRTIGGNRTRGYRVLNAFFNAIAKGVREDGETRIARFGMWRKARYPGRTGLHPRWPRYAAPRDFPVFIPSKVLSRLVNQDEETTS